MNEEVVSAHGIVEATSIDRIPPGAPLWWGFIPYALTDAVTIQASAPLPQIVPINSFSVNLNEYIGKRVRIIGPMQPHFIPVPHPDCEVLFVNVITLVLIPGTAQKTV
jgi:hypothetical protein